MKAFVTGGAGFIGSNLVDRLLVEGHEVIAYDNLSTGFLEFLDKAKRHSKFKLIEGDLLAPRKLTSSLEGCDIVFHLAANADVRFGTDHPEKDLQQNTIATFNLLEAMRQNGIKKIVFSSTGSLYGETAVVPTPENCPFPVQTSLYGSSKLACEGLIEAYCEGFKMQSWIFRFVSILGERYSHGHVYDFYRKLLEDNSKLQVLGNGLQKKSYLYVGDCIDAILLALQKTQDKVNIFNLGTAEYCELNNSIAWICNHLDAAPTLHYTGGDRGWIGDNPFIFLDIQKISSLGWRPKVSIRDGIIKTVEYLKYNHWLFEKRK